MFKLMTGVLLSALLGASPASHAVEAPTAPAGGLTLSGWQTLDNNPRLWDAVVSTPALSEPVHVAIYLPADYDSHPERRYPVLFLLHGAGDARDFALPWVVAGQAPAVVDASPYQGIVVMPQCGKACWFTDWQKATPGGYKPQWETYHVQQLLPWIDANFRTLGTREGRAIAGLSMGGFGALSMAARFPHLFGHVGSFSSATDIQDLATQQIAIANTVTLIAGAAYTSAETGSSWKARDVQDVFGPYWSDGWRSHNPKALASVYGREQIELAVYAGGGVGPGYIDILEMAAGSQNDKFHQALKAAGSPHRYCRGSTGRHGYANWQGSLGDFLAVLAGAPPATCPNGWGAPRP